MGVDAVSGRLSRSRGALVGILTVLGLLTSSCAYVRVVTGSPDSAEVSLPLPPSEPAPWTSIPVPLAARRVPPGVPIGVGESWQAKVDASPAGTTFVVRAGVHTGQLVRPKNGNSFAGEPGAVMDGQRALNWAFTGSATGVTIRGLEIRNYNSPLQRGAIDAYLGSGWVIESVNVHDNVGAGVMLGSNSTLRNSRVHHNGQLGVGAPNSRGALFDGVEIDHNNTDNHDPGWEGGASKFAFTTNLTVRNCYVHDNNGHALWSDGENYLTVYENNRVENNRSSGIFIEISYDTVIRNNFISGNGTSDGAHPWLWGAGIQIAASHNVEVYGNTVSGNGNGIALMQQARESGPRGPYIVENAYIHDNTIVASGMTGAADDRADKAIFTTRNNRFQHNTYQGKNVWAWNNRSTTKLSTWQDFGHDTEADDS